MKKIYIFLLLTTTILTASCAEKERTRNNTNENALFPPVTPSTTMPVHINVHQTIPQPIPVYIEANQPGWQRLDAIMNMTYSHDYNSFSHDGIELTPMYRPINDTHQTTTKKPINQKKEKPLLRTPVPLQLNTTLMEQVYQNAYAVIDYEHTVTTPDCMTSNKNLCILINSMNTAKTQGINEDMMGNFTYKSHYRNYSPYMYIPLLFSCLKRYYLTISTTKETLPYNISTFCDTALAQAFGLINTKATNNELSPNINESGDALTMYPAYVHLKNKLKALPLEILDVTTLIHCLYENDKILFEGYSDGSYSNLKNEFYNKTYTLLIHNGNCIDLYNLLLMSERAKQQGDIQQESDLGRAILNFDPTESMLGTITDCFYKEYSTIDTKNRISLFCELVKQYNNTEPHKKRPSIKQYLSYKDGKDTLDLVLPDDFNSSLFDENNYAFNAAFKFIEYVKKLMLADNQSVQLCVDKVYHS